MATAYSSAPSRKVRNSSRASPAALDVRQRLGRGNLRERGRRLVGAEEELVERIARPGAGSGGLRRRVGAEVRRGRDRSERRDRREVSARARRGGPRSPPATAPHVRRCARARAPGGEARVVGRPRAGVGGAGRRLVRRGQPLEPRCEGALEEVRVGDHRRVVRAPPRAARTAAGGAPSPGAGARRRAARARAPRAARRSSAGRVRGGARPRPLLRLLPDVQEVHCGRPAGVRVYRARAVVPR